MKLEKLNATLLLMIVVINPVLANAQDRNYNRIVNKIELRKEIDRAINARPELDDDVSFHLKDDGCVKIKGTVDTYAEKREAEELVANIDGVKELRSKIKVED